MLIKDNYYSFLVNPDSSPYNPFDVLYQKLKDEGIYTDSKDTFARWSNFNISLSNDQSKVYIVITLNGKNYGVEVNRINITDIFPKTDGQFVIDYNDIKTLIDNNKDEFTTYLNANNDGIDYGYTWDDSVNFDQGDNDTNYTGSNLVSPANMVKAVFYYLYKTFDLKGGLYLNNFIETAEYSLTNPDDSSTFISDGYNLTDYINSFSDDTIDEGTSYSIPFKFSFMLFNVNYPLFNYVPNIGNGGLNPEASLKDSNGNEIFNYIGIVDRFSAYKFPDDVAYNSNKPYYKVKIKINNAATKKKYKYSIPVYTINSFDFPPPGDPV